MDLPMGTEMDSTNANSVFLWREGKPECSRSNRCSSADHAPRYYAKATGIDWPPEVQDYNNRFTKTLDSIKRRHDPTVTTVAQGVLEWKRSQNARSIGLDIQAWLDRFYMSRIGIRFLIGQRTYVPLCRLGNDLTFR